MLIFLNTFFFAPPFNMLISSADSDLIFLLTHYFVGFFLTFFRLSEISTITNKTLVMRRHRQNLLDFIPPPNYLENPWGGHGGSQECRQKTAEFAEKLPFIWHFGICNCSRRLNPNSSPTTSPLPSNCRGI